MNFVSQASSNAHWMPTVFYALKASKIEVRSCHLCSNWATASSVNQRKSWTFYRGLQGPECSAPLQAPLFPYRSSICPLTCLQPQQRTFPSIWSGWLLPEDIALALSSSRYLLSKVPHLLQILAYISPWLWGLLWLPYSTLGYGPSTATHTVPMPSLRSFLSFYGTCGFPTSAITNWWVDWFFLLSLSSAL